MNNAGAALYEQLIQAYGKGNRIRSEKDDCAVLSEKRQAAFERFREKGFPSVKDEDWRFTNIASYLKEDYNIAAPVSDNKAVLQDLLHSCIVEGWDVYRIVLVNGRMDHSLSELPEDGSAVICPLSEVTHTEQFSKHLGRDLNIDSYPFAALNTAFYEDGLYVEVKAGSWPSKPLHVIHLYTAGVPTLFQPRHLVILHCQAELSFMESTACANGQAAVLVNTVLECYLEEGARLTHTLLQSGRKGERLVSHTQVSQAKDSRYDNVTISLPSADLIRNQLQVILDGSGSECHLYGLYLPSDHQLIDNHTVVDHRQPQCQSNELYKGVLRGNARAVFNGKILVRRVAQKTNAFQQNNNLLLGDKALVHSKPQLEIFADDVKCSHGSTIGQFDPESLFYLRARGIGEELAKELLVQAFGADVIDRVSSPAVQRHLEKHLRNERPEIQVKDVPHIEHI
jgi:Fe-S cluster assembly protein SufD